MENYKKLIENSTHQITDENLNKWKVIELSDLEEIMQAYHESKVKTLGLFSVSHSALLEIKNICETTEELPDDFDRKEAQECDAALTKILRIVDKLI